MANNDRAAEDEWVARVLGVSFGMPDSSGLEARLAVLSQTAGRTPAIASSLAMVRKVMEQVAAAERDGDARWAAICRNRALAELDELEVAAIDGGATDSADRERAWTMLRDKWIERTHAVGGQLDALGAALGDSGDPTLAELADAAFQDFCKQMNERFVVVAEGLSRPRPLDAAATKEALERTRECSRNLLTDLRVSACESNPVDVNVAILGALDPILEKLDDLLEGQLKQA